VNSAWEPWNYLVSKSKEPSLLLLFSSPRQKLLFLRESNKRKKQKSKSLNRNMAKIQGRTEQGTLENFHV
jgi:hypothetical protein